MVGLLIVGNMIVDPLQKHNEYAKDKANKNVKQSRGDLTDVV